MTEPAKKVMKSSSPDALVIVGEGQAQAKFECFQLVLAWKSDVIDTSLASDSFKKEFIDGMLVLRFQDGDPKTFAEFYSIIEPSSVKKVTRENVVGLYPWFHRFQMEELLNVCDDVLTAMVPKEAIFPGKSKKIFWEVIPLLRLAVLYDISKLSEKLPFIKVFAGDILFDKEILRELARMGQSSDAAWEHIKELLGWPGMDDSEKSNSLLPELLHHAVLAAEVKTRILDIKFHVGIDDVKTAKRYLQKLVDSLS